MAVWFSVLTHECFSFSPPIPKDLTLPLDAIIFEVISLIRPPAPFVWVYKPRVLKILS